QFEKNKIIQLWDVSKGKELKKLLSEDAYTMNLAFSPDGKHLATIGSNSALAIWDVAAAKVVRRFATRRGTRSFLGDSPDGKHLLTGDYSSLCLWELAKGREVCSFAGYNSRGAAVAAFSPDGQQLAVVTTDPQARTTSVRLYEVNSAQEVRQLRGMEG